MHTRFVAGGVRFFAFAWLAALALLLMAPLPIVRVLCMLALAGATAGFLLHLLALRAADRQSFNSLGDRPLALARSARDAATHLWARAVSMADSWIGAMPLMKPVESDPPPAGCPTPLSADALFRTLR